MTGETANSTCSRIVYQRTAEFVPNGLGDEAGMSWCEVAAFDDGSRESQLYWLQRVG
jgi:hypothetical protein